MNENRKFKFFYGYIVSAAAFLICLSGAPCTSLAALLSFSNNAQQPGDRT